MAQVNESPFVGLLAWKIKQLLPSELRVERGHNLDYQSAFAGRSIFETDICVLEGEVPRVVMELKTSPTTHDVMVYSQKADDHKRLAPQLVYGMVAERGNEVATKLLKHNRHMDFALYLEGLTDHEITETLRTCIASFVEESRLREKIASGNFAHRAFFRKTTCI